MQPLQKDVSIIRGISSVPAILDVICRTTGMGFAAVTRVTEERWVACSVLDHLGIGIEPGDELAAESTLCERARLSRAPVVISRASADEAARNHPMREIHAFESCLSMPVILSDGRFFGTLCAMDPQPDRAGAPATTDMFRLFAELIAFHIGGIEKLAASEDQLRQERENAELREQFIAVLGHDLRNPLGAITTGSMLLQEAGLEGRAAALADVMAQSAKRMSELIDDIMDFARGRLGGGIDLESVSDVPLVPVLEEVIEGARSTFPGREIETRFEISGNFRYDRKRLTQLFTNLLGNALTHGSDTRPVKVEACTTGGKFRLSVANPSDPIPPEVLERMFQPFARMDPHKGRKGLGLGLYIASEIAKAHGGTLAVASTGGMTRFTFEMPAAAAEQRQPQRDKRAS